MGADDRTTEHSSDGVEDQFGSTVLGDRAIKCALIREYGGIEQNYVEILKENVRTKQLITNVRSEKIGVQYSYIVIPGE